MESLILERITALLKVRKWYRINRWADWPDLRKENEVELRALLRLARQHRKEFRDHPVHATYEVDPEFNPGYVMGPGDEVPRFDPDWNREGQPEFNGAFNKW